MSGLGFSAQLCLTPRPCSPVVLNPICLLKPPRRRGKCQCWVPPPVKSQPLEVGPNIGTSKKYPIPAPLGSEPRSHLPRRLLSSPPPAQCWPFSHSLWLFRNTPIPPACPRRINNRRWRTRMVLLVADVARRNQRRLPYQLHINVPDECHADCTASSAAVLRDVD